MQPCKIANSLLALAVAACSSSGGPVSEKPAAAQVCYARIDKLAACSGAEWAPGTEPAPRTIEICDRCETDAHCGARKGGRCLLLRGDTCEPNRRLCQYPADACYEPDACIDPRSPKTCHHKNGTAVCAEPEPPPA